MIPCVSLELTTNNKNLGETKAVGPHSPVTIWSCDGCLKCNLVPWRGQLTRRDPSLFGYVLVVSIDGRYPKMNRLQWTILQKIGMIQGQGYPYFRQPPCQASLMFLSAAEPLDKNRMNMFQRTLKFSRNIDEICSYSLGLVTRPLQDIFQYISIIYRNMFTTYPKQTCKELYLLTISEFFLVVISPLAVLVPPYLL